IRGAHRTRQHVFREGRNMMQGVNIVSERPDRGRFSLRLPAKCIMSALLLIAIDEEVPLTYPYTIQPTGMEWGCLGCPVCQRVSHFHSHNFLVLKQQAGVQPALASCTPTYWIV